MSVRVSELLKRRGVVERLLDLVIVVVGVFIAFQVDRGYEQYRDRQQEQAYLHRLHADIESEIEQFEVTLRRAENRIEGIRFLEAVATDPERAADQPGRFVALLESSAWLSFPLISRTVYRELLSTGGLSLFRSEELLKALAEYYSAIDHHEQLGRDRSTLAEFDREIDGLITVDQMIALESGARPDLTEEEAVAVARRFQSRTEAVELLPELAGHHRFNQRINRECIERARAILAQIEAQQREP